MNIKNMLRNALVVFLFSASLVNATAEEKKGTIRNVEVFSVPIPGVPAKLEISVDTTGNRIPDHVLTFPDPAWGWSRDLRVFAERGMEIIFDNEGSIVAPDGIIIVNGDNTKSIDGVNMLDLFPNEAARFKFAAKARLQSNGSRNNPVKTILANAQPVILPQHFRRLNHGRG